MISLAGPVVNLLFPVLLLTGFYAVKGEPYPPYLELPVQVVGMPAIAPSGPEAIMVGDKIVSIAGTQVRTWEQADKVLRTIPPGTKFAIEVKRTGTVRRAKLYYLRGRVGKATRLRERKAKNNADGTPIIDKSKSKSKKKPAPATPPAAAQQPTT